MNAVGRLLCPNRPDKQANPGAVCQRLERKQSRDANECPCMLAKDRTGIQSLSAGSCCPSWPVMQPDLIEILAVQEVCLAHLSTNVPIAKSKITDCEVILSDRHHSLIGDSFQSRSHTHPCCLSLLACFHQDLTSPSCICNIHRACGLTCKWRHHALP